MSVGVKVNIQGEITEANKVQNRFLYTSNLKVKDGKDGRVNNSVSMYDGLGKMKIYPKPATGVSNKSGNRKSQSSYIKVDKNQGSIFRLRKKQTRPENSSFSAVTGTMNPLKQFKRQTLRSKVRASLGGHESNLSAYLQKVQQAQAQFITYCHEQRYNNACQVIIRLLNYTIDYNLPEQFLRALKLLADINFFIENIYQAVFYYNQIREASLLLNHNILLVQSLIGLAQCCCKCGVQNDGISILKKALQYAWLFDLHEQELRLFDEIGKLHYHLGDLQKAKQYHLRHINALYQPANSALRILSRQRLAKAEQLNIQTRYNEISLILLVHLKIPVKTIQQIPLPFEKLEDFQIIRNKLKISNKYFFSQDVSQYIKKILNGWFFAEEMQDPFLPSQQQHHRQKRYNYLDFQLNKFLKRLEGTSKKKERFKPANRSIFPVKESVQEQVARKIKQPPMQKDWYEKIVKQINRDHKNKLLNIRNAVRIRGFNKKTIPSLQIIRDLFNSLFQRSKIYQSSSQITKQRQSQ